MRKLEQGIFSDDEHALLHIICALGAKFYALEFHQRVGSLPQEVIRSAGRQWAKTAEGMIFADYGRISVHKLMVRHVMQRNE